MSTQKVPKNFRGLALLLFAILVLVSPTLASGQEPTPVPTQIAMASISSAVSVGQANVRAEASTSARIVETITAGTQLTVSSECQNGTRQTVNGITSSIWMNVQTPAGNRGCIFSGLIQYVVTDPRVPNVTFRVTPGIDTDVSIVASGTLMARQWLAETFEYVPPTVTISLFNQESSGLAADGGSGAVAFTGNVFSPRFYVLNSNWVNQTVLSRVITSAHENIHGWQVDTGCLVMGQQSFPQWLVEGQAQWGGLQSAIAAELLSEDDAMESLTLMFGAQSILQPTLNLWENPNSHATFQSNFGYNWGALATGHMVELFGEDVLKTLCQESAGNSWRNFGSVFEDTTDMTLAQFYTSFNSYITELGFVERQPVNTLANGCVSPASFSTRGLYVSCQGVDNQSGLMRFIVQGSVESITFENWMSERWNPDNVLTVTVPSITGNGVTARMQAHWDTPHEVININFPGFPNGTYATGFDWRGEHWDLRFTVDHEQ